MRGRWWPWLLLVLALVPALLIQKPRRQLSVTPTQSFSEAIFANPDTLDPALASTASDWAAVSNVFAPLFRETPNGRVVPSLVSHYSLSGKQLILTVRPVPLVGGGHLTADTVAAALARPLWPRVNSSAARTLLGAIVGAKAVMRGKTPYLSGITVDGRQTLTIQLTHAVTAQFVKVLANPILSIVPASDLMRGGPYWQLKNLDGTGGYALANWVPNGSLTFHRRSGSGPAEMTLTVFPSFQQAVMSFRNQAVDLIPVGASQVTRVPRSVRADIRALPVPGDLYLVYRRAAKLVSAYPDQSVSGWVKRAFAGRVPSLGGSWPSSVPAARRMTVYVNQALPEAVQLAQTLQHLRPALVTVRVVTEAQLASLAKQGTINAYIGQANLFKSPGVMVPLAPLRQLWLVNPQLGPVRDFANGVVNWHSIAVKP